MDKKFKIKDNKTVVKLICLALSFGLWMYISNVENPIRQYKLDNVPVQIINTGVLKDSKLALIPNQNLTVNLNLEGHSTEIYKIKKDQFKVVIDLSRYALKKGENNIPVEIRKYPSNISIRNNNFLRVNVELDNYIEKTIPIESKVKVTMAKSTYMDKIKLSPSEASVSGAQICVDKVKSLIVKGEVNNMENETKMSLPIVPVDEHGKEVENINLSVNTTDVTFKVTKGKEVPIKVITKGNLRDGLAIKAITPEVEKVKLLGNEDVLNKINSVNTEPIDISQFGGDVDTTTMLNIPENTTIASGKNQIKVKFSFSKTITKELDVPLNIKGDPTGLKGQASQQTIKVKIRGLEESISSLNSNEITCNVDVSSLNGSNGTVKVNVVNPYENIQIVNENPQSVKITFTKE